METNESQKNVHPIFQTMVVHVYLARFPCHTPRFQLQKLSVLMNVRESRAVSTTALLLAGSPPPGHWRPLLLPLSKYGSRSCCSIAFAWGTACNRTGGVCWGNAHAPVAREPPTHAHANACLRRSSSHDGYIRTVTPHSAKYYNGAQQNQVRVG